MDTRTPHGRTADKGRHRTARPLARRRVVGAAAVLAAVGAVLGWRLGVERGLVRGAADGDDGAGNARNGGNGGNAGDADHAAADDGRTPQDGAGAPRPGGPAALPPPGALAGAAFLAACVRCGLCVPACPYGTLRLAGAAGPVPVGTPYFVARDEACRMCETLPCVRACPTGALDPRLAQAADARMGLARLAHPGRCFSVTGAASCVGCLRACPLAGRALVMRAGVTGRGGWFTPSVDPAVCTGCGRCEQACLATRPAIVVEALQAARPVRPRAAA
jgi:ferredoxin-type protein NapG